MDEHGHVVPDVRRRLTVVVAVLATTTALLGTGYSPANAIPDDDPDLRTNQRVRTGVATPVPTADLAQRMISLGDTSQSVADLATQVFRDNASLLRQANDAPAAAVFGRPHTQVETDELPDSFVVSQTTTVVVGPGSAGAGQCSVPAVLVGAGCRPELLRTSPEVPGRLGPTLGRFHVNAAEPSTAHRRRDRGGRRWWMRCTPGPASCR